ncbi:MAG: TlyA family rRNA (cytidine-2'-O)-methyltransferase [Thermodesulfovibrionales bacterium]
MKERLDKVLVERGLAQSRERAKALIMEGKVLVEGRPETKPGALVGGDSAVSLKGEDIPFVSRGGVKLKAALDHFGVRVQGKSAMDVGASTGGFTDCLLSMGASKVFAVDVGYGQFDWRLRNDPRVVLLERTNIRHLERDRVPGALDMAVIDVSFISLTKVVPRVVEFLRPWGEILALIKPQFEVGKGEVGKGGVVRDEGKRLSAVESLRAAFRSMGLEDLGTMESPVRGQKGNVEYFIYLRLSGG